MSPADEVFEFRTRLEEAVAENTRLSKEKERYRLSEGSILAKNIELQHEAEGLQHEIKRLKHSIDVLLDGLKKFHPKCPDNPCPGVWPYCNNWNDNHD